MLTLAGSVDQRKRKKGTRARTKPDQFAAGVGVGVRGGVGAGAGAGISEMALGTERLKRPFPTCGLKLKLSN